MRPDNSELDRLLRSASRVREERPASSPFGFDTRVVALWRSGTASGNGIGLARLVRRVAIVAAAVIVISSAATIREFQQAQENMGESMTNEFAIADTAIQNEYAR